MSRVRVAFVYHVNEVKVLLCLNKLYLLSLYFIYITVITYILCAVSYLFYNLHFAVLFSIIHLVDTDNTDSEIMSTGISSLTIIIMIVSLSFYSC